MIKKFRAFFVCLICLYPFVNAFGAQKITLAECEKRSLEISPSVKFAQNEYKAAEATAEASETDLFPVLALEGKAYYVAAVPELDMNVHGIGQINKKLGDNLNYSAGFALRWNLFDGGVQKSKYEAAKKFAASKKAVFDYEKKKTLMETRIAYFNLISAASNLKFIDEQLELSASQNKDIKKSVQLGAKSKLDEIMSDNEVLIKQKQKNAAKILLIEAADKLNSLTGNAVADWVSLKTSRMPCHSGLDPESTLSLPSSTLKSNLDSRWNLSSSVLIGDGNDKTGFSGESNYEIDLNAFDSPEALLEIFSKNIDSDFDAQNPQLLSFDALKEYYDLISNSCENMNFPRINIFMSSSYDYPSGPDLKPVWQNTAGADFSMPVYQFGKNAKNSKQYEFAAMSAENKKEGLQDDLKRLFYRSKEKAKILYSQIELNKNIISQSKIAADMTYKSYISGNLKYLDVQYMNLKVLEAMSGETDFYAGLLTELVILEALKK